MKIIWVSILMLAAIGVAYFLGTQKSASTLSWKDEDNQIYAYYKGQPIRASDVRPWLDEDLRQIELQRYSEKQNAVKEYIREKYLNSNDSSQIEKPLSPEQLDLEFEKVLQSRNLDKNAIAPKKLAEMRKSFIQTWGLRAQERSFDSLVPKTDLQWTIPMTYLEKPVKVGPGELADLVDKGGSKQIVVFTSYHCPGCSEALARIKTLASEARQGRPSLRLRFVWSSDFNSLEYTSVRAAICANEQSKFPSLHEEFVKNPPLKDQDLWAQAQKAGLNLDKLKTCLKSKEVNETAKLDHDEAKKLNVFSPGAIFINGHRLPLQETSERIELLLNQAP